MNTIAWLFILIGLLVARQTYKGRIKNIGEDLSDAMLAFVQGDTDALGEILTRKGEAAEPTTADLAIYNVVEGTTGAIGTTAETIGKGLGSSIAAMKMLTAAVTRGEQAKGYRWAATGPDYYDCSGLMWRAAQDAGYKGSRFTTATISSRKEFKRISSPATQGPGIINANVGDIVLWKAGNGGATGHMGIVTAPGKFYSARSVKSGIGEANIKGYRGSAQPTYLRFMG